MFHSNIFFLQFVNVFHAYCLHAVINISFDLWNVAKLGKITVNNPSGLMDRFANGKCFVYIIIALADEEDIWENV